MSFRCRPGRFPSLSCLTSCQPAWLLSRLRGSGTARDSTWNSFWFLVFLFFLSFEIRGKRSWKKYKPALRAFFQLFRISFLLFLIMMTSHSTSWFVIQENRNSFPPWWKLSCPWKLNSFHAMLSFISECFLENSWWQYNLLLAIFWNT